MDIFKAEGLRNFPLRGINVYVWNRVKMNLNPVIFILNYKNRETFLVAAKLYRRHAEILMMW
jgi:hypothetical protein